MKNMIKEKKTLLILRVVFGVLLLAGIIGSVVAYKHFDARIVKDTGYADDYNPVTGTTDCAVEVELNVVVVKAQFQVAFYDETGEQIDIITENFVCEDKIAYATFKVDGAVDTYELLAYDITYESNTEYVIGIALIVDVLLLVLFIQTFTMSCRIYNYNGSEILVYAGFTHRYLKVDGVKVDERSTAFTYGTVSLNFMMPDGAAVWASITRTNKITLRVNNQVLPEVKNPPANAPAPVNVSAPASNYGADTASTETDATTDTDPFSDDNL